MKIQCKYSQPASKHMMNSAFGILLLFSQFINGFAAPPRAPEDVCILLSPGWISL